MVEEGLLVEAPGTTTVVEALAGLEEDGKVATAAVKDVDGLGDVVDEATVVEAGRVVDYASLEKIRKVER